MHDERHAAEDDFPDRNLATAVVRMEGLRRPSDLIGVTGMLHDWLRSPEDDGLRRAFADWVWLRANASEPFGAREGEPDRLRVLVDAKPGMTREDQKQSSELEVRQTPSASSASSSGRSFA